MKYFDRLNVSSLTRLESSDVNLTYLLYHRMAGVFDIELHDGDAANQDESDDDVIENREVECIYLIRYELYS